MAIPFATGCLIPNILQRISPAILPKRPVIIIAATVIAMYPSSSCDSPMPIAVVIDFGNRVTYSLCPKVNRIDIAAIVTPLVSTPDAMPMRIAVAFFLSS